jgi:peptidoglycan-associated lipoprotein
MRLLKTTLSILAIVLIHLTATAQRKTPIQQADEAYFNRTYYNAIDLYKKAYSKAKKADDKRRILYHIGLCYYELQDNGNAQNWLSKAVKAGYDKSDAQYYLAEATRMQGKYDEAIVEFQALKEKFPDDKRAEPGIKSCQLAQEWKDNPTRYVVEPEPLLNSKQYDFSPVFSSKKFDELVFTSSREGSVGNEMDPNTGENFSGLWSTKRDKKGKWAVPVLLSETVNTAESNEGSAAMDKKFKKLYFTRCQSQKNKVIGCAIYSSAKRGREWDVAELVKIKSSDTANIGHPAVGLGDQYMFFASDMEGGQGGKDIWMVKYDKKKKEWSDPVNMTGINTPGDEMFPFIHKNGDLYFASNGHPGMGGLDIFVAKRQGQNDRWSDVQNMKYPINSPSNDFGIVFEGEKNRGFLSSDRDGTRGKDDIWSFRVPPLKFIIDGGITDVETGQPISGAKIMLVGTDGSSVEVVADELGYYEFDDKDGSTERYIAENTSYTIEVTASGYLKGKGQETTVGIEKSTRFKHDFKLQSIRTKEIKFPEVRYDFGRWELQVNEEVNSKDSLDYLYQTLTDNPNIVVELMAHTDTRGGDAANLSLSQKRAQSCVDYLVSKGIPQDRMVAKGYGESEPIMSDDQINALPTKEEQEAAHQKNRRTTFRVIRDDYVPAPTGPSETEGAEEEGSSEESGEE